MSNANKYTQKLANKHILIIGGSSGIGYCVAEASIEFGARVSISSSNPSRVDAAVQSLKTSYPLDADKITGTPADLADRANLEAVITNLLDTVVAAQGSAKIDHVVITAGGLPYSTPLADVTLEKIQDAGLVRFFAPILVVKHALARMNPGPESSITLTTGSLAERPRDGRNVMAGFASGMQGLTRGLALDLKPLRVNLVISGVVDTNMFAGMPAEDKERRFARLRSVLPTGQIAKPEQVAESFLYLMRDENVTGSAISTNGGFLLVGPS